MRTLNSFLLGAALTLLLGLPADTLEYVDMPWIITEVKYHTCNPLKLTMNTETRVEVDMLFSKQLIDENNWDNITVLFKSTTLSPQFDIMNRHPSFTRVFRRQLESSQYTHKTSLVLLPTYIGRADVYPGTINIYSEGNRPVNQTMKTYRTKQILEVVVVKSSRVDIWESVFVGSVLILMIVSYINLGAQLDLENLKEIIKRPKALILGFFVTILVMPLASWLVGMWILQDQLLYRVGSFIFATCPPASASTLWTVMLNSDKELSVGLQAISTATSLITMPALLYLMEQVLKIESTKHTVRVPYARLIQTQFVLIVALLIGFYLIGRHERAQKISSKIFKPLTFFILLFIVFFSVYVYWHIYIMFDWTITLAALLITLATYGLSGLLGLLVSFDLDRAIAISISSTYKNSGIAFAVLLFAFESPDIYINYVPCLTQVLTTSITLYLIYSLYTLVNFVRRRNQPDAIQATTPISDEQTQTTKRSTRSGSGSSEKSTKEEDNDEFIAMNVTDVIAGSPVAQQQGTD